MEDLSKEQHPSETVKDRSTRNYTNKGKKNLTVVELRDYLSNLMLWCKEDKDLPVRVYIQTYHVHFSISSIYLNSKENLIELDVYNEARVIEDNLDEKNYPLVETILSNVANRVKD